MRIVLFTETYLPYINGVVTHIKVLKDGLIARGHEVLIVCPDPDAKKHYLLDGVLHCPARRLKKKILYGYSVSKLDSKTRMNYIREFNPDVLHMHQEFSMGIFAVRASKRLKKPLVYTLHTMYDEYSFYLAPPIFSPIVCFFFHIYIHFLTRRVSIITSPSIKAKAFLKKCFIRKDVEIIPNSIDFEEFNPKKITTKEISSIKKKLGIKNNMITGIFVGRLGKEKSIDLLLDYLAPILKNTKNLRLIIVGDGPEYNFLTSKAKELDMEDNILFTGSIPHDKVVPYFLAGDFFITASITEMMSISMLEGMALGLVPVLRYDEVNFKQIEDGVNGFIYRDTLELEKIIKNLMQMCKEERLILREKVRASVKDKGSLELADYMIKVYEKSIDV